MKRLIKFSPFLLGSIIVFLLIFLSITSVRKISTNPLSSKNQFQDNLNYSLRLAGLNFSSLTFREYLNQVEFSVVTDSQATPTKVIFRTDSSPVSQVASLQKLFKLVKMKGRQAQLVDLSLPHPYVTLKNN